MTRFRFSEHKSDVTVFATGSNLPDVVEPLAEGMFRIIVDPRIVQARESISVESDNQN